MKKAFVLLVLLFSFAVLVFAEEAASPAAAATPAAPEYGWKKPFVIGSFNYTQAGFDNWMAGGENTLSWLASLNAGEAYDSENIGWENTLKLKFGQLTSETGGTKKSDDEIRFDSLFKYKLGIKVDPFASFMWQTQLAPGYVYSPEKIEISAFMDPGYLKESAGFIYAPWSVFSVRLGAAVKHIVTDKYSLAYAGEDTKVKTEPGAELVAELNTPVWDNVFLTSKAEFFSNLKASDQITVLWDNMLSAKINSYLTTNFNLAMKYNMIESFKRQLKESLSIGLTYNFL